MLKSSRLIQWFISLTKDELCGPNGNIDCLNYTALSCYNVLRYNVPSDMAYASNWSLQKVHRNPYKKPWL